MNVYAVLSNEQCNIALIFHRTKTETQVYLAVVNTKNAGDNSDADEYIKRLTDAVRGNFPGSVFSSKAAMGSPKFLAEMDKKSVAIASNIPTEKSEKFISQTIEAGDKYIKCYDIPSVSDKELAKSFSAIDKIVSKERSQEKKALWTNMTMIVTKTGQMHTDFDYTDLSEGKYQFKKNWKKKYLC